MESREIIPRRAPAPPLDGGMPDGLAERLESVAEKLEQQLSQLAARDRERVGGGLEMSLVRAGISDIESLIAQTRTEVAGLVPPDQKEGSRLRVASGELDSVVGATEQAAVQIMAATEKAQDAGARIRAMPDLPPALLRELDAIDEAATDVFMACSFQDLTGQRIRKVVHALTYVEARVKSLSDLWSSPASATPPPPDPLADARPDAHLMNGPSADGLVQDDVDNLFGATVSSQSDIDSLFN